MDLGRIASVAGVVTQCRTCCDQCITAYRVLTSTTGSDWAWVDSARVFTGNYYWEGLNSKKQNYFYAPVQARFVRWYV